MNRLFVSQFIATAAGLMLLVGCGDGSKSGPITIKGADKVLQALEKKDYEAVVAGLAEVKNAAGNNPEIQAEYRRLRERITDVLVPKMGTDEAARQAYRALSMLETGR